MAEDVVVKDVLTPEMIHAGAELTRLLDANGRAPSASFWFFLPDAGQWRLLVALPDLPRTGPRDAYTSILGALQQMETNGGAIPLGEIEVLEPEHPLVQLLRAAIRTGDRITGIRFSKNAINGQFIEDAYIYRLL